MNNPVLIIGAIGTVGLFFAFIVWMIGIAPMIKQTGTAHPNLLKAGWILGVPSAALVGIALVIQ